jgi:hypothetical protein
MDEAHKTPAESKQKHRRGYSSLDAIDPQDGGKWQVLLPNGKMDYVASQGRGATMELADTVRWTLLNPSAIFRGIRDLDKEISDDHWLCYVSRPKHAYNHKTGKKQQTWMGEVFLVFVTDERILYNWYWAECDPRDSGLPADYETRFLERRL